MMHRSIFCYCHCPKSITLVKVCCSPTKVQRNHVRVPIQTCASRMKNGKCTSYQRQENFSICLSSKSQLALFNANKSQLMAIHDESITLASRVRYPQSSQQLQQDIYGISPLDATTHKHTSFVVHQSRT